jgi:hypothetical protein
MYWQGFWFRVPRLARQLAGLFLPSVDNELDGIVFERGDIPRPLIAQERELRSRTPEAQR